MRLRSLLGTVTREYTADDRVLIACHSVVMSRFRYLLEPSPQAQAVGIYSTASMWRSITGGHRDATWLVWVPGSGSASCSTGFTGGPVWLVQTKSGASEGDLAC
jgi:hypothetical protein